MQFDLDASQLDSDEEEFTYPVDGHIDDEQGPDSPASPEPGDYSARLDDILSDGGEYESAEGENEDDGFLYTGMDAPEASSGYQEQLKDVLDGDHDALSDDNHSILHQQGVDTSHDRDEWVGHDSSYFTALNDPEFERSPSPPDTVDVPAPVTLSFEDSPDEHVQSFFHPSISRLRSGLQAPSPKKHATILDSLLPVVSDQRRPSPSSFSDFASISRTSSRSNLEILLNNGIGDTQERAAFKWTSLRSIGNLLFMKQPEKATAILGTPVYGMPTVLAVNSFICVGTSVGKMLVFDFRQRLICVCGVEDSAKACGPVTAVAISRDHTFVACGHAHGHIQLFDLKRPTVAARTVNPTTISSVVSGRSEGHILGSRIVSIGFIAGRHTGIVTADDQGLAFFHSLGKVLFMDANDCLRILGKYPAEELRSQPQKARGSEHVPGTSSLMDSGAAPGTPSGQHKTSAILAVAHLPLGTIAHSTDSYQLIALITSVKLVVVGLKPTPKTWFRRHREEIGEHTGTLKWRGSLAWFPSVTSNGEEKKPSESLNPLLAYSWGSGITVLRARETRVSHKVQNEKTGKVEKVESGKINFDEFVSYTASSSVLAMQWLNMNQIIIFTAMSLEVLDVRNLQTIERVSFDASRLVSSIAPGCPAQDVQHSIRTYRGKIFILSLEDIMIGTLLTWADRILSFVEQGNFLSAIKLARDFYLGQAEGNKNGLPEDESEMRALVGQKLKELMDASSRYAFSEDRFTDSTHASPDNRGVDRTSLFEDLVTTCASACSALDDFEFLFEDLFQYYDDVGIPSIYLRQLEPFILDDTIHDPPARITQRLIALHDEEGSRDAAERLIWHIDPDCLDINQVLTLCRKYQLYDAMIYINNTALRDYITPLIEFLELIRDLQRGKRSRYSDFHAAAKPTKPNAYKIFGYLSNILCGLTYPSGKPLPADDALKAQNDIYSFLFHGRSQVWPGEGHGRLVLTAEEEGGVEPTYPYVRLLLRFDAEALLHVLDLAFEQSYLNESEEISRRIIVKILMDIADTSKTSLRPTDITFINIFVARNVPKYPQFIHIGPSSLQNLLISLASDVNDDTREDRQLAAEFLLSAYTPHDSERITQLFEEARFFRILRSWYKQDCQWSSLLRTYVHDTDMDGIILFQHVEETLQQTSRLHAGQSPDELIAIISDSIPLFLEKSISRTAYLLDTFTSQLHREVIKRLGNDANDKKFRYLRCLLGRPGLNEDGPRRGEPSSSVDDGLQRLYVELLCRLEPKEVLDEISFIRAKLSMGIDEIGRICEEAQLYDVVIWLLNEHSATSSMSKYEMLSRSLSYDLGTMLSAQSEDSEMLDQVDSYLDKLTRLYRMGIRICREHSQQSAEADAPVEDLWFSLLATQIDAVQSASSAYAPENILAVLRSLVQDSLTELVSVSTTMTVSFPRLFKRLVDVTRQTRTQAGTPYHEFRNILTGMLASYRSEEDILVMSKRIVDADFFDAYSRLVHARSKGWSTGSPVCSKCRSPLMVDATKDDEQSERNSIAVSPSGIYHSSCINVSA